MSEEINETPKEIVTPAASNNQTTNQGLVLKDVLVPLSIVVAGIFVGAGLYFSGGTDSVIAQQAQPIGTAPAAEVDNTGKISPVTAEDHIKGSLDAPIKIVEYSDFDCPFCSRFHDVMNSVTEKYSGDEVAWVYRQFPLEQLHPQAPAVAIASECVAKFGGNDAFWEFADDYFAARGNGSKTPHSELIPQLVVKANVNPDEFTKCFENGEFVDEVQSDINNAVETGGRGTPWSIIIGPSGKTYPINGALPQSAVEQLIELAKEEA